MQERLKAWETREKYKARDAAKEKEKRRIKEEEKQKEAKRLKEFLEDYDDERDDVKYYKYEVYFILFFLTLFSNFPILLSVKIGFLCKCEGNKYLIGSLICEN